jgi:uncharacterized protein
MPDYARLVDRFHSRLLVLPLAAMDDRQPTRRLDRDEARQIAVRAQLLDAYRPTSLLEVVDHLTLLQIDPTKAIALSPDLIAWSRLGDTYSPSDLTFALEQDRTLVEYGSFIRPMADLGVFLALVGEWPRRQRAQAWVDSNQQFRDDVMARLAADGPLVASAIDDTSQVAWESTGWTNDRNVTMMLEILTTIGEAAVSGRDGRQRKWDLAERVYPPDLEIPPAAEAAAIRDRRRLTALGITRQRTAPTLAEPTDIAEIGTVCEVDGSDGLWLVDPDALAASEDFVGRTALLSPYDRLVYDRDRALDLFDFEYVLEMYKPAAKRRWGYFALPILHGDQLVGKLDAKADRKAGVLNVYDVHEDVPFSPDVADGVEAEIDALADWLGLAVTHTSH